MSKGKQQTNTSVPEYQESFYRDVYDRARSLSNTPFQAYTGQMVADMNPAQQQQYNQALTDSQRAGMFDPTGNLMSLAGQSASVDSRALSTDPIIQQSQNDRARVRDLSRQDILRNIGNYLNPAFQLTTDVGLRNINEQRDMQKQKDQDLAISRGAFGGSRSAILEGQTDQNYNRQINDFLAQQGQQNFQNAFQMANADLERGFKFADLDARLGLANTGNLVDLTKLQAGLDDRALDRTRSIFGDVLDQQQNVFNQLGNVGTTRGMYDQARLDAERSEFDRRIGQPGANFGFLTSALSGLAPITSTESKKKVGLLDAVGPAMQIASLFSDIRLKEDLKHLYTLSSGHKVYSWKWNKKARDLNIANHRTTGVIAQEVMEINPGAVKQDARTGMLMVNYGDL